MTPERWKQVEQVLDEALEHDPETWPAFLDETCTADPDLRREVEALLRRYTAAEHFLTGSATEALAPGLQNAAATPFKRRPVGPYQLVRELGRGGMGTVFLAERDTGTYRQQVALKLLRPGLNTEDTARRFRAEQQILAALTHPGIARLLDGGVTDDGQPFLAMEYVEGRPIDQYCDDHRLPVNERLTLFVRVCEAVQYAHRNLVVHRDLKPSNILVTEDGAVKLLDFGIAKLLDDESAPITRPETRTGQRWMTPEYAAPEQITGAAITTATDAYQLGVVLYELLSGHRPFEHQGRGLHAIEQAVLEEDPKKPSTAATRVTERLRRTLQDDLDTIVLKALRKEPEARYASAEAFLEDIKRYLAGLPVEARRRTLGYRAKKFVRRHRWGVAAAVVFALVLAGYAVTVTLQTQQVRQALGQARLEAEKSDQVISFLMGLFEANDPREARGDSIMAWELLTRGLDQVETLGEQPEVQAQMLDVVGRVYRSLGQYDKALPLLERAVAMRRTLLGDEHPDVAQSLNNLASLLKDQGNYDAAEPFFREALAMRRTLLGEKHPDVAQSLNSLGTLLDDRGDYDAAERLYREALAMRRALLGEEHPDIATTMNNLGLLLMEKGDYDQAEALHRETLAMRRKLLGEEHLDITYSLNNLALVLNIRGDYEAAESLYRELLALDRKLLGEEHPEYALDLNNLAGLLQDKGDYDGAEALYREALAIQKKVLGDAHPRIAQLLNNMAALLHHKNDFEAAEPLYREALAMRRTLLGEEHPAVALTMNNLSVLLRDKGDYAAAEPLLREALAMRRKLLGEEHPSVATSLHNLASLFVLKGDYDNAESLYREAVQIDAAALGEAHWVTAYYKSGLGACLTALTRYTEAELLLLEAHAILQSEQGDQNSYTQKVRERLVALYEAWGRPDEADAYRALNDETPNGKP